MYALGNASVGGLRALLRALGAAPGGPTHAVITDLREEVVLYVRGTAYLRRELEMPAAALHHAGAPGASGGGRACGLGEPVVGGAAERQGQGMRLWGARGWRCS